MNASVASEDYDDQGGEYDDQGCEGEEAPPTGCVEDLLAVLAAENLDRPRPRGETGRGTRRAWSFSEDERLRRLNHTHNHLALSSRWVSVAEAFNSGKSREEHRTAKQIRSRWLEHLDPSIKKVDWTEEERDVVKEAQARLGNKWSDIAKLLPGRTDNQVKNLWYCSMRKVDRAADRLQRRRDPDAG